jgi:hypothetical protein
MSMMAVIPAPRVSGGSGDAVEFGRPAGFPYANPPLRESGATDWEGTYVRRGVQTIKIAAG